MTDNTITLEVEEFRKKFLEFSDEEKYSEEFLQNMLDAAQLYINPKKNGFVNCSKQKQMIYLLTAHLASINTKLANGDNSAGLMASSAHIEDVSVTTAIPESNSEFEYFLNSTGYGRQLLALLSLLSGIGLYIGGQKENVFR